MNARDTTLDAIRAGTILAGRYLVERRLGEGGMGVVVAARHLQLGHRVAIKFLAPSALENDEAVERFRREAWAAAQITSPHVVQVSEVANLPTGMPFIVMEYLEGEDLSDFMERDGRVAIEVATRLILQVCEAIAEAHAVGVVHRDLKPSNIFCTRDREGQLVVKVLDFGVSKLLGAGISDLSITTTRMALGSPLYMSPEQMQSAKAVDERTDIWSIGVILYELLTATHPFDAESLPDLAIKVSTGAPALLRESCPDIPGGLERVVLRCLEKVRERRFDDVAVLARALVPYAPESAHRHAVRSEALLRGPTAAAVEGSQAPVRAVDAGPTLVLPKRGSQRVRLLRWGASLGAVTLAATVAWAASSWMSRERQRSAAAATAPIASHYGAAVRTSISTATSADPVALPRAFEPRPSVATARVPRVELPPPSDAGVRASTKTASREKSSPPAARPFKPRPPAVAGDRTQPKRLRPAPNALLLETQELGGRL